MQLILYIEQLTLGRERERERERAMFTSILRSSSTPNTVLYSFQQGWCVPYPRTIDNKSNVWKKSQRSPSIFVSSLGSTPKPALPPPRRTTSSVKHKSFAGKPDHDTVLILNQNDDDDHPISFQDGLVKTFSSLYKFCRPYAIVGTVIGVSSFSLFPVETMSELSLKFLVEVLKAIICVALMNIHLIGMNQVFDIEIDRINKPYLLLASGEMSLTTAKAIVVITGTMSIAMALLIQSPPLLCVVLTYFLIGGAYSIDHPFLRWKKNAFLAVFSMTVINGLAVPIGIFMHTQKYILRKPITFTRPFVFSTSMAVIFIFVIAIFKDVPDLDGDEAFGMKNFVVIFGKEKIFLFSTCLMMLAYGVAVVYGSTLTLLPMKLVTMLGHNGLALILWSRAQSVDLSDNKSTSSFYSFIWKLHYAEYFLIHFLR